MTEIFETEVETTTTSLDMRRLQRHKRRQKRRAWTLVLSAVGLVVLAIGGSIAWNFVKSFESESTEIADFDGTGQGATQVIVEQGDTGADIAHTLYEEGVVASEQAFINAAKANSDSASITPGYYILQREMKAEYAVLALLDPDNRNELSLNIPEGKNLDQILQAIANLTSSTLEEVEAAAENTEALGLPEQADGNLEGWLFPSTYTFDPNVQPADVLAKMLEQTITVLNRNDVPEDRWEEVLTVASIIERETRLEEDRPMVAGVIYNRLDIDMKLQMDSTVKYLTRSAGVYTTADERAIDDPYNTYMYEGLPPGPIASPGEAAINAAMNPTDHDYLYFVTVNTDTGETLYAETFDEHQKNVAIGQKWAQDKAKEAEDEATD
ncbi:endolytic transglycosylase MltG [Demequina sp.]|uniref:endolytic transglycosylase MltG n=1 Tax=Demequina sp. TaxID=2050685 RepID=UPI003A84AD7A